MFEANGHPVTHKKRRQGAKTLSWRPVEDIPDFPEGSFAESPAIPYEDACYLGAKTFYSRIFPENNQNFVGGRH